jgi:hypothetical protein
VPHRVGAQRELFDRALAESDPSPQVHLQHFLTKLGTRAEYPYNYDTAEEMAKSVEAAGRVVAVLAGHYHPGASFRAGSGVLYATAPALCIAPHPVWVLDLDGTAVQTRVICLQAMSPELTGAAPTTSPTISSLAR